MYEIEVKEMSKIGKKETKRKIKARREKCYFSSQLYVTSYVNDSILFRVSSSDAGNESETSGEHNSGSKNVL